MAATAVARLPAATAGAPGGSRHGCRRARRREEAEPLRRQSDAFEAFYQAQAIVPEAEWAEFLAVMRRPLPVVVRINRTKATWSELQSSFAADARWSALPWFSNAWQCQAEDFDDGLRGQCSALNKAYALRFQEAASLVPPLLLEAQAEDMVLDMCAAPGSKTLECLELMREESAGDGGVVIANDGDAERCFELLPLITRKARHPGTAVLLGSASKFPGQFDARGEQVLFNRIICDVPCSGDGTLRKRPEAWKGWSPEFAMALHPKQLQILCRGLCLLKPGGRLVYSTCSLNPVENEAIVQAALARFRGDVALVADTDQQLRSRGLHTGVGLGSWRVPHPTEPGCVFQRWEDVPQELRKPKGLVCETMFPVTTDGVAAARCIRLHPHHIDGSGFFVAVFTKLAHRVPPHVLPQDASAVAAASTTAIPWRARNESNRYEVVAEATPEIRAIAEFYGLAEVPSPLLAEYNVKGRLTQLNWVNKALLQYLQLHLNCRASPLLVSVGVPLFKLMNENFMTNIDVPSRWRPATEGAEVLGPRMSRRALRMDLASMRTLLSIRLLPMARLQEMVASGDLLGLDSCGDLLGGCVAGLHDDAFWTPCIITGLGLELYGSADELGDPRPSLSPKLDPVLLAEGLGYAALAKPSGLRTEDALRWLRLRHSQSELVSRLDKGTSGCLLVATSPDSARCLTEQFAQGIVSKTYLAVVWGEPLLDEGLVEAPLALSDVGGGTRYRAYVDEKGGKASATSWRVLARAGGAALLAVYPKTGRTHQIRCHMAHIGFPLVGDTKYGGRKAAWCERLPLHCARVRAVDVEGRAIDVQVPLPEDLSAVLEVMTGQSGPTSPWRCAAGAAVEPGGALAKL